MRPAWDWAKKRPRVAAQIERIPWVSSCFVGLEMLMASYWSGDTGSSFRSIGKKADLLETVVCFKQFIAVGKHNQVTRLEGAGVDFGLSSSL